MKKFASWRFAAFVTLFFLALPSVVMASDSMERLRPDKLSQSFDGISPELYKPVLFPWLEDWFYHGGDYEDSLADEANLRSSQRRVRVQRVEISPHIRAFLDESVNAYEDQGIEDEVME